jgi:hypothetical protein
MLLIKVPVPDSSLFGGIIISEVLLSEIVGPVAVLQQTPLAVTVPPFSLVIVPPETAVVWVIELIEAVVNSAVATALVVNVTSDP